MCGVEPTQGKPDRGGGWSTWRGGNTLRGITCPAGGNLSDPWDPGLHLGTPGDLPGALQYGHPLWSGSDPGVGHALRFHTKRAWKYVKNTSMYHWNSKKIWLVCKSNQDKKQTSAWVQDSYVEFLWLNLSPSSFLVSLWSSPRLVRVGDANQQSDEREESKSPEVQCRSCLGWCCIGVAPTGSREVLKTSLVMNGVGWGGRWQTGFVNTPGLFSVSSNTENRKTDLKIMTFRKLMSLNTAYNRKIAIITVTIVVVVRGLHDCDMSLTCYQHMKIVF